MNKKGRIAMVRYAYPLFAWAVFVTTASASPSGVSVKVRFDLDRNGNFAGEVLNKITDPNVIGAAIAAGCAV